MSRGQPRRDNPNNHDVLPTHVRDDQRVLLRGRVSGHARVPTDLALLPLVLRSIRLLTMSGTDVRDQLAVLASSPRVWLRGRLLRPVSTGQHGLGRRGSWFQVPSSSRSIISLDREINVSPRQELAAADSRAVPVSCGVVSDLELDAVSRRGRRDAAVMVINAGATAASTPSSPSCWLWPVC